MQSGEKSKPAQSVAVQQEVRYDTYAEQPRRIRRIQRT